MNKKYVQPEIEFDLLMTEDILSASDEYVDEYPEVKDEISVNGDKLFG